MDLTVIIVVLVVLMAVVALLILLLTVGSSLGSKRSTKSAAVSSNLRALVAAQRERTKEGGGRDPSAENLALAAAAETDLASKKKPSSGKLTIAKKIRYAHAPITPIQFRAIQIVFTIAVVTPTYLHATVFIQLLAVFLAPLIVENVLDYFVNRRFKQFDDDYPVLLMQYVSLLKTGMNTIGGLEAAAKGLDSGSLVRAEVELLIERLKLGLTEEQALGAFGEDIPHPELELFVQSLILSRRVGGTLSNTLERLARQVRKRQQFRKQAVAAVGMERSSIWMIALIMTSLLIYLSITSPELVLPAFKHELGNKIFQGGLALILGGFYWSRRVTDIKI